MVLVLWEAPRLAGSPDTAMAETGLGLDTSFTREKRVFLLCSVRSGAPQDTGPSIVWFEVL